MSPGYSLGAGFRMLEVLLGRVPDLGDTGPFSTQVDLNPPRREGVRSGAAAMPLQQQKLDLKKDVRKMRLDQARGRNGQREEL
jgi:hypothetical protein